MTSLSSSIVINDAARQGQRRLSALAPDFARVDGRSRADLLDFAVRFGRLIHFYNLRDEPEGDWERFFLADPAILLASVETSEPEGAVAAFRRVERRIAATRSVEKKWEGVREAFGLVLNLARELDRWLGALQLAADTETALRLGEAMEGMVHRGLGEQLRLLKAYDEGAEIPEALGVPVGNSFDGFLPVWDLARSPRIGSIYRGRTDAEKLDAAVPHLYPILDTFQRAMVDLKRFARDRLGAAIDEGRHRPQVALYLSFVRLFETAQNSINAFPGRLAEFYHRRVLRESPRQAVPAHVYLTFTAGPPSKNDATGVVIPKGACFPAGKDSRGRDVLFALDRETVVNRSRLVSIRTLRVVRGPAFTRDPTAVPTGTQDAPAGRLPVRRVLAAEIRLNDTKPKGSGPGEASAVRAWAPFGGDSGECGSASGSSTADLGFAVASRYLGLEGGQRRVIVEVECSEESFASMRALGDSPAPGGVDPVTVLGQVLNGALELSLSTALGWLRIPEYHVAVGKRIEDSDFGSSMDRTSDGARQSSWRGAGGTGGHFAGFTLELTLRATVPPVVALGGGKIVPQAPAFTGSNPAPDLPTLRVHFCPDPIRIAGPTGSVVVHPLGVLAGLDIEGIRVRTRVDGLPVSAVATTEGPVLPGAPFAFFGALPAVGSHVDLRHPELFDRRIQGLWVAVRWLGLPQDEAGMFGHYRGYVLGPGSRHEEGLYDNRTFRVSFRVIHPGWWDLDPATPSGETSVAAGEEALFRTAEDGPEAEPRAVGALHSETRWERLRVRAIAGETPPYYLAEHSALRIELAAPRYAFGHALYARNVQHAVVDSASRAAHPGPVTPAAVVAAEPGQADACASLEAQLRVLDECLASPEGLREAAKSLAWILVWPLGYRRYTELRKRLEAAKPRLAPEFAKDLDDRLKRDAEFWSRFGYVAWPMAYDRLWAGVIRCRRRIQVALKHCRESARSAASVEPAPEPAEPVWVMPQPPHVPHAESVRVGYSAEVDFRARAGESQTEPGGFFHVLPFDGHRRPEAGPDRLPSLVPRFSFDGNLFLGFSNLTPPPYLTLLFRTVADGGGSLEGGETVWEYLAENRWNALPRSAIQVDESKGLRRTGIVGVHLPPHETRANTILTGNQHWLRVGVRDGVDAFPGLLGIHPHAARATQISIVGGVVGESGQVPAGTIQGLASPLPGIEGVEQPMGSFGGRSMEDDEAFRIRVGERLRHKERAIVGWDYERLVLERFPEMARVKVLPSRGRDGARSPGHVLVVVVPGLDGREGVDPTAPLVHADVLEQVQKHLEDRVSPFVRVHVVNPFYVRVQVRAALVFVEGEDPGACAKRLNRELVDRLSPWAGMDPADNEDSEVWSERSIREFLQSRPYVDGIASLELCHDPSPEGLPWCFLTTAKQHEIREAGAEAGRIDTDY